MTYAEKNVDPMEVLANKVLLSSLGGTTTTTDHTPKTAIIALADQLPIEFVAKLAVFAYKTGKLRDMGAFLTAYVSTKDVDLFKQIAPLTLDNLGQIRKYVNFKRCGVFASKSFGSASKKYINKYLSTVSPTRLLAEARGANPSMKDIISLTHPKPTAENASLLKYWMNVKDHGFAPIVAFNAFRAGLTPDELPAVPSYMIQPELARLTPRQRYLYLSNSNPNTIRRELLTYVKLGWHKVADLLQIMVSKITDNMGQTVFPHSLYETYKKVESQSGGDYFQAVLSAALEKAIEQQLLNAFEASNLSKLGDEPVSVVIDCSGSMYWNTEFSNNTTFVPFDIAVMFAYGLSKLNNVSFHLVSNRRYDLNIGDHDSYRAFHSFLHREGKANSGGTCLHAIFEGTPLAKNIILISDNETQKAGQGLFKNLAAYHINQHTASGATSPKIVLWDIKPNGVTVAQTNANIANVSGFSESTYNTIGNCFYNDQSLVDQINSVF